MFLGDRKHSFVFVAITRIVLIVASVNAWVDEPSIVSIKLCNSLILNGFSNLEGQNVNIYCFQWSFAPL